MKKLLFTFALTMLSTHVADAASGFYAGVSAGQSNASGWCDGISRSCDDSDAGWKILWGYQATENLGVEVSFVNFGESTVAPISFSREASGFGVVGTGTLPVSERFGLLGKVGLFHWDAEFRGFFGELTGPLEQYGIGLTYGLGATVEVTGRVGIRVEWEQFEDVGDSEFFEGEDLRLLSAGVLFSF